MAKDEADGPGRLHWFPFYPGDFERDTKHLDAEEIGAYLGLLIHQWSHGSIPDDVQRLVRITKACEAATVEVVSTYFPDGINPRLERERVRATGKSEKARESALKRWHPDQDIDANAHATADANALLENDANADAVAMLPPPQPHPDSEIQPQSESQPATKRTPSLVSDAMWSTFKDLYPDRRGNQYWAKARKHAEGLLKANVEWSDIMAGVRRYRAQCEATGMVGSEKIKQAQFWLAPKEQLWTEDFPLPTLSERTSRNVANLQRALE